MTRKHAKSDKSITRELTEVKNALMEQKDFPEPKVQEAVQAVWEMEREECLGAARYERTEERVGTISLRVPQERGVVSARRCLSSISGARRRWWRRWRRCTCRG